MEYLGFFFFFFSVWNSDVLPTSNVVSRGSVGPVACDLPGMLGSLPAGLCALTCICTCNGQECQLLMNEHIRTNHKQESCAICNTSHIVLIKGSTGYYSVACRRKI